MSRYITHQTRQHLAERSIETALKAQWEKRLQLEKATRRELLHKAHTLASNTRRSLRAQLVRQVRDRQTEQEFWRWWHTLDGQDQRRDWSMKELLGSGAFSVSHMLLGPALRRLGWQHIHSETSRTWRPPTHPMAVAPTDPLPDRRCRLVRKAWAEMDAGLDGKAGRGG